MHVREIERIFRDQLAMLPDPARRQFLRMYSAYVNGDTGKLAWSDIRSLIPETVINFSDILDEDVVAGVSMMSQVAFLKLNGGLGTSMGCEGPKSLVPLYGELTFMDLICQQVLSMRERWTCDIPFVLMNSFYTDLETREYLADRIDFLSFQQHQFPRILTETKGPFLPQDRRLAWNPPGHGDVYWSLWTSGILETLLSRGIQYAFISNSDNLGPGLEPGILGYMHRYGLDFLMEMTPKTEMDVKGGTVVRYRDRLALMERSQVEDAHKSDFEDVNQFPYFNTNNIWVNLVSVKKALLSGTFDLPLIVNPKVVEGQSVVQLESAMGAAIGVFEKSGVMVVSRDRFLPVKHMRDLHVIQSDLVVRNADGFLAFAEGKEKKYPVV
jgi:UTP--glucose-1-phosphate uridylyltransferase